MSGLNECKKTSVTPNTQCFCMLAVTVTLVCVIL